MHRTYCALPSSALAPRQISFNSPVAGPGELVRASRPTRPQLRYAGSRTNSNRARFGSASSRDFAPTELPAMQGRRNRWPKVRYSVQYLRSRVPANGALGASRARRTAPGLIGPGRISPAWTPGLKGVGGFSWKLLNAPSNSKVLDQAAQSRDQQRRQQLDASGPSQPIANAALRPPLLHSPNGNDFKFEAVTAIADRLSAAL